MSPRTDPQDIADAIPDEHPDASVDAADSDDASPIWKRWPRFNPHLRLSAKGRRLRPAIRKLTARLVEAQHRHGRKRGMTEAERKRFDLTVEALACNLAAMTLLKPGLRMRIALGSDAMNPPGDRSPEIYGRQFPRIVHLMADEGVLDLELGHLDRASRLATPSSVAPGPSLAGWLPDTPSFADFIVEPDDDVLLLRARRDGQRKGALLPIADTPATRTLRRQVVAINRRLAAADIQLSDEGGVYAAMPYDRTLRRYFNNGAFDQGGRLFGGFWMNMHREDRFRLISIGGEPVVNVDYGQLFPRLAYRRVGVDPGDGDLYDMLGDGSFRAGWKQMMNAVLFASHPLKQWPSGIDPELRGMSIGDAVHLMEGRHRAIAPLFGTGVGYQLMFTESCALIDALEQLGKRGITALPVHDSVIVAQSRGETARVVMQEAMARKGGISNIPIKIDTGATE